MSTGAEHYIAAEESLKVVTKRLSAATEDTYAEALADSTIVVAMAQVHATLAAVAVAVDSYWNVVGGRVGDGRPTKLEPPRRSL